MNNFLLKLENALDYTYGDLLPTKPLPTKPLPTKPTKPKRDKWFPKPGPNPKPKAMLSTVFLIEDYDSDVHSSIKQFWDELPRGGHDFSNHPIMAIYGKDLSRAGYRYTMDRVEAINASLDDRELFQIFTQIMQIESMHKSELENAAISIVSEIWKVPEDLLNAMLTQDIDIADKNDSDENDENEEDDSIHDEVKKRITMNTLSQGAAVHSMMTIHHMARKVINNIDNTLMQLYDKISSASHGKYWLVDLSEILSKLAGAAVGSVDMEFEDDKPRVSAKGMIFPVLIQELVKGVMEILTYHHLSELGPETAKKVINKADKLDYELFQIQVGPELWRRFIAVVNKAIDKMPDVDISDVIVAMSVQKPTDLHDLIMLILDNRDESTDIIKDLLDDHEVDIDDYSDDGYDDGYGDGDESYGDDND